MSLVSDVSAEIALRIHDVANAEISTAQLLSFVNMAVKDARNAGWLIDLEEDESLTEAATTFSFAVPANFAYIRRILRQNTALNTYDFEIDRNSWRLGLDGGVAVLFFDDWRYDPIGGAHLKIIGQKRPTLYTAVGNTVDAFLDAFLREKATYYAGIFASFGESEYARTRQQAALLANQEATRLLSQSPQVFRMHQDSRHVPGR